MLTYVSDFNGDHELYVIVCTSPVQSYIFVVLMSIFTKSLDSENEILAEIPISGKDC